MTVKEVLLVLTDRWADWEASYAIAEINACPGYVVKTIAVDKQPKSSIGGLRACIDYDFSEYTSLDNLALLILPGGFSWAEQTYDEIADFVRKAQARKVPIAAICGATQFLAKHGFLNQVQHTGDEPEYFYNALKNEPGYTGHQHFVFSQVVMDGGIITANETAAVAFAHTLFCLLEVDDKDELDDWFATFQKGMA